MIHTFLTSLPTQDRYFIGLALGMLVMPLIVVGSFWVWPVV